MKQIGLVIGIFLLVNVVLALLVAPVTLVWLASTGRLSSDRWERMQAMFSQTVEEELAQRAAEEAAAAEEEAKRQEAARLEAVSKGTMEIPDRILARQEVEAVTMALVERLKADNIALRRLLDNLQNRLETEKLALDAEREAFEEAKQAFLDRMEDEQFRKTVELYENVRAKQARLMFHELISRGKEDQVVDYLMAMDGRKAAGILKEFKDGQDIPVVTSLLEKLRQRGAEFIDEQVGAGPGSGV